MGSRGRSARCNLCNSGQSLFVSVHSRILSMVRKSTAHRAAAASHAQKRPVVLHVSSDI